MFTFRGLVKVIFINRPLYRRYATSSHLRAGPTTALVSMVCLLLFVGAGEACAEEKRTSDNWYSVYEFYQSPQGEEYDGRGYWWANSHYGYTKQVPAPWTAVQRVEDTLHAANHTYEFGDELLLEQVHVGGAPLLVDPVALTLEVEGQPFAGAGASRKPTVVDDRRVCTLARKRQHEVTVQADTCLDFDGSMRFDLSISAPLGTRIDQLSLAIPLRREVAKYHLRYLDYDFDQMRNNRFRVLDSLGEIEGGEQFSFRPTVWIGDEQRGLEWVSESNIDWHNGALERAMAIDVEDDRVVLRANLINAPVQLGGELRYSFTLLPTPT